MARAWLKAVLATSAVWLVGCGTTANLFWRTPEEGAMQMYGGVKMDAVAAREGAAQVTDCESVVAGLDGARAVTACVLDLPFSAIADTLTLPIAMLSEFGEAMAEGDKDPRLPRRSPPRPVIAAFPYQVSSTRSDQAKEVGGDVSVIPPCTDKAPSTPPDQR